MTNPELRDPAANLAYYRTCRGYKDNKGRFEEPRVKWVAKHIPKVGSVLDAGCNDGFMAELMPPMVEWVGIELNPKAVAAAYPKARGRIYEGDVMTATLGAPYDVVLCLELLEHVPDPTALLRRLGGALKPGGVLITTSALGRGEVHEPGNQEHLREWNPPEYARLHMQAGLIVLEQASLRVFGERFTNGIVAAPGGAP